MSPSASHGVAQLTVVAENSDARLTELAEEPGCDRVRGLFREVLRRALQEPIDAEVTGEGNPRTL